MAEPKGKTGSYAIGQGPPGKCSWDLGRCSWSEPPVRSTGQRSHAGSTRNGLLVRGHGQLGLLSAKSFDAASGWARHSMRRELGLALLSFACAIGLAEAIAVLAYGQHLFG